MASVREFRGVQGIFKAHIGGSAWEYRGHAGVCNSIRGAAHLAAIHEHIHAGNSHERPYPTLQDYGGSLQGAWRRGEKSKRRERAGSRLLLVQFIDCGAAVGQWA